MSDSIFEDSDEVLALKADPAARWRRAVLVLAALNATLVITMAFLQCDGGDVFFPIDKEIRRAQRLEAACRCPVNCSRSGPWCLCLIAKNASWDEASDLCEQSTGYPLWNRWRADRSPWRFPTQRPRSDLRGTEFWLGLSKNGTTWRWADGAELLNGTVEHFADLGANGTSTGHAVLRFYADDNSTLGLRAGTDRVHGIFCGGACVGSGAAANLAA